MLASRFAPRFRAVRFCEKLRIDMDIGSYDGLVMPKWVLGNTTDSEGVVVS